MYPVKEKKKYEYIQTMMEWVLDKRLEDKEGFHKQQDLDEGDPRRLSKTIAPVLPPPTSEHRVSFTCIHFTQDVGIINSSF